MTGSTATTHLTRAYRLTAEVEESTEHLGQQAIQHSEALDQPIIAGTLNAIRRSRKLRTEKSAIISDLDLAWNELNQAVQIDPNASIETAHGVLSEPELRSLNHTLRGLAELHWGSENAGIVQFKEAIEVHEYVIPHFWLAIVRSGRYEPGAALKHYERCLELEPDGKFSVAALRCQ